MASVIIAGKARPNPPVSSIVGSRCSGRSLADPAAGSSVSSANPATMA